MVGRHTFLQKLSYSLCSLSVIISCFPALSNNNFESSMAISAKGTGWLEDIHLYRNSVILYAVLTAIMPCFPPFSNNFKSSMAISAKGTGWLEDIHFYRN